MTFKTIDLTPRIGTRIESDLDTLLSGAHAAEIRELALERRVMLGWRKDLDGELLTVLRDTAVAHPWPGRSTVRDMRLDFAR